MHLQYFRLTQYICVLYIQCIKPWYNHYELVYPISNLMPRLPPLTDNEDKNSCRDEYEGGKCFSVNSMSPGKKSWFDARYECEGRSGARLVEVDTPEFVTFMSEVDKEDPRFKNLRLWIGATKIQVTWQTGYYDNSATLL